MKNCNKCGIEITEENRINKGIRNGINVYKGHCNACENTLERVIKSRKGRLIKNKRLRDNFTEFKKTLSCEDCGMSFKESPWLCDFHHLDPKLKDRVGRSISYLVQLNTKTRLEEELKKCIPLCSNCHRTRHHFIEDKSVFRSSNSFKN